MSKQILCAPSWMSSSEELRWVAAKLQTGKPYMVGMGRTAMVIRALQIEHGSDEFFACWSCLEEGSIEQQVFLLALAAELINDQCQCCGRSYDE